MQYRASFVLQVFGQFIATGVDFIAIAFLLSKFGTIKGWSLWEVGLLYGMTSVSFAIAEMFSRGFDLFSKIIRLGEFDRFLIRPVGIFVQLMASDFDMRKLGRILQGLIVMIISWHMLDLGPNTLKIAFTIVSVLNGTLFYMAIIIAGAGICFWSIESTELPNILTYGGVETLSYPISIYKRWFRNALIFIIPLAFVNYFPALYILDRQDPLGLPYIMRFLFPLASAFILTLAIKFWNYGVQHLSKYGKLMYDLLLDIINNSVVLFLW